VSGEKDAGSQKGAAMNPKIEQIKKLIEDKAYQSQNRSRHKFWGGADVIIAPEEDERTRKFLAEQNPVISFQEFQPQRQVVITKFARELIWLFYQLKDCCSGTYDFSSKYDFFGLLALAARNHLEKNPQTDCKSLLLAVLKQGDEWLNSRTP
jgi:hypothetical protein